jgi:hypothetical protein
VYIDLDKDLEYSVGWRTEVGRSAPSHLHSAKILCTHGNVTHGDFRGASGAVRTQPAALYTL